MGFEWSYLDDRVPEIFSPESDITNENIHNI